MSVRVRLSLVITLLIGLAVVSLIGNIQVSSSIADSSKEVSSVGQLRERSIEIESLSRQVASAETTNQNLLQGVESQLDSIVDLNRSIAGLFNASSSVEPDEFNVFVAPLLTGHPEIGTTLYVPRVLREDRADFEAAAADVGYENFQIIDIGSAFGEGEASGEREAYFPVFYGVPFENIAIIQGVDITSTPELAEAVQEARRTGESQLSRPISAFTAAPIIGIVTPLYPLEAYELPIEDRDPFLRGFIIQQVVLEVLTSQFDESLILEINDITSDSPEFIYQAPVDGETATPIENSQSLLLTLPLYGRVWGINIALTSNTDVILSQLDELASDLDTRIAALENGNEDYGFYGLDRFNNSQIQAEYEVLVENNQTFQSQIEAFRTAESGSERLSQISMIEASGNAVSEQLTTVIGLLEDELDSTSEFGRNLSVAILAIGVGIALFGFVMIYQIIRNLSSIRQSALVLSEGDLKARVMVKGRHELAQIGQSINIMATQLNASIEHLEDRIEESTRNLQAVVDVNTQISAILDVERLLRAVTNLTKDRFNLYHAHVYLLNERLDTLVLAAGAGYVGRQMVAEGREISIYNQKSIVAQAANSQSTVVINETATSPYFLPNPLLPDTRAELAVALISRGQLLGVLDVQSDQVGFFDETSQSILETLAGQIATAISNTRLYENAIKSSRHDQVLSSITESIQNANSVDDVLQTAIKELGKALRVPHTAIELQLVSSVENPEHENGFDGEQPE
jgi:putative methionine-R-sulfoxide reductase with GAF domain